MNGRIAILASLLVLSGCGSKESISVEYANYALLLVSKDTVAILDFDDGPFGENEEIRYKYRERDKSNESIKTGDGVVFEKYRKYKTGENEYWVVNDGGVLHIQTDTIRLEWSSGGSSKGWIYFNSGKYKVETIPQDQFEKIDLGAYIDA